MTPPYYQDDSETIGEWLGCYDSGWQGKITPESFSHPAKFSRALIRRIYEHAFAEGWLAPGISTIVDPFAGVGLGALDAMWNGLNYIGVELEPKFVALGQQNLALWQRKYGSKEGWGTARIIQGDSRRLAEVIGKADLVCSSPPYSGCVPNRDRRGEPWFESGVRKKFRTLGRDAMNYGYGSSSGQLGAMKEGDFDCVVSSPPYSEGLGHGMRKTRQIDLDKGLHMAAGSLAYGETEGQLGSLPEGRFEAVIGSPPYEGSDVQGGGGNAYGAKKQFDKTGIWPKGSLAKTAKAGEGYGAGDMGFGPTFWSAAREIVAQCHAILKPGGHAIWVCKDFVRKGKRVPFSDQWQALCESVGFRLVCRHRAMLVNNHGEQETIFGGTERLTTERKSFFRRLAEKKGSPRIDHEDILCLERI